MKLRPWTVAPLIILLAATTLWWLRPTRQLDGERERPDESVLRARARPIAGAPGQRTARPSLAPAADAPLPSAVTPPPKPVTPAASAQPPTGPEMAPGVTPTVALQNVRSLFRQYQQRFGGNPVGTNEEITRALNGANPKHVVFISPDDGLRLNERGELIDNWGTPYFFHQLSGSQTEIHSAGPDRRMWTADDLVMK